MVDISTIPGIEGLVTIGKTLGIVAIIYVVFLIISSIVQVLYSLRFKKLAQNVEEINKKMNVLIGKGIKKR